jgi:hypothetical protein
MVALSFPSLVFVGLQTKRFVLPQESEEMDEYYCNESTYANLNILFVAGVMRLDSSVAVAASSTADASSKQETFDTWPSKEQKKGAVRKGNRHLVELGVEILDLYDYEFDECDEEDDGEEGDY